MATVRVTKQCFEGTEKVGIVFLEMKGLDMDQIRRKLDEMDPQEPRAAKAGGA